MSEKKPKPKPRAPSVTVKIDGAVHYKARIIAAERGLKVSKYLTSLLTALVDKDYAEVRKKLAADDDP